MSKTQLYIQIDGNGKGKLAEILSESQKGVLLCNVRSGFEFIVSQRNFNNHYVKFYKKKRRKKKL